MLLTQHHHHHCHQSPSSSSPCCQVHSEPAVPTLAVSVRVTFRELQHGGKTAPATRDQDQFGFTNFEQNFPQQHNHHQHSRVVLHAVQQLASWRKPSPSSPCSPPSWGATGSTRTSSATEAPLRRRRVCQNQAVARQARLARQEARWRERQEVSRQPPSVRRTGSGATRSPTSPARTTLTTTCSRTRRMPRAATTPTLGPVLDQAAPCLTPTLV